jgi:hypothetical protein
MTAGEAWFNSLGIAQANSVVYTSLFFSILMFFVINYLNYVKKIKPKIRTIQQIAVEENKNKRLFQEQIETNVKEFGALRKDMLDGTIGFKYDVTAAVEKYEEADMRASNMKRIREVDVEMTNITGVEMTNPLQHRV